MAFLDLVHNHRTFVMVMCCEVFEIWRSVILLVALTLHSDLADIVPASNVFSHTVLFVYYKKLAHLLSGGLEEIT